MTKHIGKKSALSLIAAGSYKDVLSRLGVPWMKLHLDKNQPYNQFVCGPNHESDRSISEYRGTCPYQDLIPETAVL